MDAPNALNRVREKIQRLRDNQERIVISFHQSGAWSLSADAKERLLAIEQVLRLVDAEIERAKKEEEVNG